MKSKMRERLITFEVVAGGLGSPTTFEAWALGTTAFWTTFVGFAATEVLLTRRG